MSVLTSVLVAILSGYLALTTALADSLVALFPPTPPSMHHEGAATEAAALTRIQSEYADIPKVVLEYSPTQVANALSALNTNVYAENPLEALVNIFCTYTRDGETRATTGSGFFIDSDGIILTNAHVAQYLLLEEISGETNCIIRTGNPAEPTFEVALLYISPAWILKNAASITQAAPRGTGERDYALLYVTEGIGNKPLPRAFASLPLYTGSISPRTRGLPINVAGYPAETAFAAGDGTADLIPKLAPTTITDLMTFGSNLADVMSIGGSDVGEQGSSGGPILTTDNTVIGIISTRGDDERDGYGSLRALTLSYIARTYEEETTQSFALGLSGDLPARAAIFKQHMTPILLLLLQQELVPETE